MGMFYWLATEPSIADLSEAAEAHGLGFNTDILEANLINLAIAIAIVVYFGKGLLTNLLSQRRTAIETEINESETRKQTALKSEKEQQGKVAQAEAEAQRILAEAQVSAKASQEEILAQAILEMQRLEESATQDQSSSQAKAIAELRQRTVELALKKAEQDLQAQLASNEDAQRQLIDRSIALLGGRS